MMGVIQALLNFLLLFKAVDSATFAFVASCKHDLEFSKTVAYNLAQKDVNTYYFVTDAECADAVSIPNVETFAQESWVNQSRHSNGFLSSYSNVVQDRMDEVVRSAETFQRLLERQSVQLAIIDSYSTCAAAVAELHDIPVILLHNTGFPQPTANPLRVKHSFVPAILYRYAPEFLSTLVNEAVLVLFKNLPDVRMTISVGNKCNLDLQTNVSHSSVPHFWSSYPRIGSYGPPLIEYNKKTKHFLPLGHLSPIEKGKPKSTKLNHFLNPASSDSATTIVEYDKFVYFTGEKSLVDRLGWEFFLGAFSIQPLYKTIWTNHSLPSFQTGKHVLTTSLSAHSVLREERIVVVVGVCSLDNLILAIHYEKILLCFDMFWRESSLATSVLDSQIGSTFWPMFVTRYALSGAIEKVMTDQEQYLTRIKVVKSSQTSKLKMLKELVFNLTELPSSSWKRKAVDPVNHYIELAFIVLTFIMFMRFFIRSGRRVFSTDSANTKQAKVREEKNIEDKKTD